jgi:replicative DNA helicase
MTDLFADIEAERMVLGSVLADNAAMNVLAEMLTAKHFSEPRHRLIFGAMLTCYERSQPIDFVTMKAELADNAMEAGGIVYVAGLQDGMPRVANPEPWAAIVVEKARRRAAKMFASRFLDELMDPGIETEEVIERHQDSLTRLQSSRRDGVVSMREVIPEALKKLEAYSQSPDGLLGIPSGLPDIDRVLCGWQKGALYVVASRPGRGKSTLCAQAAVYAGFRGFKTLYIGMEMRPAATTVRMICSHAGIDRFDLRQRPGYEASFERSWKSVSQAAGIMGALGIWFDQRESPTVAQIRALAKQHQASRGCDLLVVDYLQRCSLPPGGDQWVAVGDIAKNLKSLAQSLNIPIIAACQLNADAEEKRPTPANLAQARGVISAEADVIAFLHPQEPAEWKKQDQPTITFIIDKNRDGPTADVPLSYEKAHSRFTSVAESYAPLS